MFLIWQRETHLGGSEQVRDPDTVPQNAERALGVALDDVVVDTVEQGDHRVVCEGTLNLFVESCVIVNLHFV